MVYLGDGWGEVVLPSPGSEPPPPYSPPRVPPHHHHQHFFPEAFASSSPPPHHLHHHHPSSHAYCQGHFPHYYEFSSSRSSQPSSLSLGLSHNTTNGSRQPHPPDPLLDTKPIKEPPPPYPPTPFKSTHPALNHGPSSAFSPPTKSIKYSYPPPYTPRDTIQGEKEEEEEETKKKKTCIANQGKVVPPVLLSSSSSSSCVNGTTTTAPHPALHHSLSSHHSSSSVGRNAALSSATGPRGRPRRSHQYSQDKTRSLDHQHHSNGRRERDTSRSTSGSRGHRQVICPNEKVGAASAAQCGCVGVGVSGHPKGPLLKTGKSLELPHERLSSYHRPSTQKSSSTSTGQKNQLHPYHSSQAHHVVPPTAHIHPGHSSHCHPTKDVHLRETKEPFKGNFSKSSKLAYVGIMPSKPHSSRRSRERDSRVFTHTREYQFHTERLKEQRKYSPDPRLSRYDDRWARRTSKLEAAAAQAMMPARAVPATAIGQSPGSVSVSVNRGDIGREPEVSWGRGRLRSCRSLDELSDFLDDEVPRLPVVTTRSLDDLTEPLYENLDVIHAHARDIQKARIAHNTSVPDLLEPPPRPPRQRNNSLSSLLDDLAQCGAATALSRRALNTSVPDVLERGVGIGGLGGKGMGIFPWSSPTSTLCSGASTLRSNPSNTSTLRSTTQEADNTSDIGVQLQKIKEVARVLGVKYRNGELSSSSGSSSGAPSTHTSPRMPSHAHGMPMQAPGVPARAPVIHDVLRDARKSSPQQHPDNDVASQESGYSSMDSRSCRQLQQQQQNNYLQRHHVHTSFQYPETIATMDGSSEHQRHHPQPLSLLNNNNRPFQCTKGPPSLDHYQSKDYERLSYYSQHQQRSGHADKQGQSPEYRSRTIAPLQQSSPERNHLEGKGNKSRHPYPSRNTGPLRPPFQQEKSARQVVSSSHQVPQEIVVGHHTQQGVNQDKLGIYIKSVVPGGAADQDGRLQAGDQLLTVDGKSLIGITQERAAEYMMETGPVVTLEVARQGAIYHGLATILSQPSPQANRASLRKMRPRAEEATRAAMTNSQSTPNMGGYNERLVDWNQPPRQHPLPPTTSHNSLLARSSPNLAAAAEGYPGGRHLSERDLPSKVLREHSQDPPTHPHQAPRMQSSKSVPSLNSDGGSSVVGGKAASLEVFNPSYSRTSSNTSLSQPPTSHVSHHQHHMQQQQHHQQQQQPPVRSRSIQNLSDGSYQGAVGRHPSNPSLVVEEERYYQNVNFHQGPQDPRMGSTRTRPAQPLPLGSPTSQGPTEQVRSDHIRPDPRGDHRPASAFMQREDMMSHRNDLQRPASQRDIRADAKMMEMTEEVRRREERMRLNGHSGNPQQQRPGPHQPHHRVPNAYPANSPFSADGYGGLQGFPSQQHSGYHPASSQTLSPQGPISGLQVPPQHHPHSQYPPGQPHGFPGKHPPPTAPKPKSQGLSQTPLSPEAPEKPSRQFGYDGIGPGYEGGPPRPPPPEDGYRDSPPPPPPPTSTHPLLQGSRPTSSVGYSSNQLPNKAAFNAASPWDREEKDRNDRRRREAVRHWRDEQISSLEALEVRTSQQDERLRTLRLEKEFQRRAEEALTNEDDDDEDEDDDEADDPNENENKDSSRQTLEPLIKEDSKPLSSVTQEPRMNGGGPVDDERARRVDEIRRKQQELEAASEVEERLLREAQRRQQEEQMRQKQQQAAPSQHLHYQHQHHASQRLDSLVATPFQPQYSNGPVNGMRGGGSHASYQEHGVGPDIRNRGESVVSVAQNSPVPPERGSSYSVMQQQTPTSASSNSRYKGTDTSSATIKRVQFSETPATVETHITYDSNANQEKTPQDPNLPRPFYKNFINEAETLLNSSPTRSIIGTPGVIGAQEVYRDPRMRRLQQKQAEQAAAKNPGPEKLTFKEKMKMFAMETGEGETPKDKVKISRAQRDIEH
ncbi:uncharacterized protein LOC135224522 isoform X11 [Macrobrachium nipponense]|uniref:uncharacterized protein LOC135224522 isoform X11 n=1 Tax=Macrobrachium nipponense TaxID=159736 RepID=UPI0030C86D11